MEDKDFETFCRRMHRTIIRASEASSYTQMDQEAEVNMQICDELLDMLQESGWTPPETDEYSGAARALISAFITYMSSILRELQFTDRDLAEKLKGALDE